MIKFPKGNSTLGILFSSIRHWRCPDASEVWLNARHASFARCCILRCCTIRRGKERKKEIKKKGKIVKTKRRRRRIRGSISNLFLLSAVAIRPCPMAILSDYRTTIFEFRKGKRTRMDERTYSRRASGRLRFLVPRV